ncbi:hypothetical protein [uncultured Oxalicibacterium sp.]|uniref:COG4648 family protein n=1 Tax=uncultured Oxalicibacterium sp. TaxID=1168540 RepID=UPI0025CFBEAA|nr:hypothetical protein [uncultured Oxalicibacterium sp.]
MSALKLVLTIIGISAYVALSHAALVIEDAFSIWRQLAVLMLIVPIAAFLCWGAFMAIKPVLGIGGGWLAGMAVAAACIWAARDFWTTLLTQLDWIYLIQHITANTMLCWFFLQTLYGGRTPIITTIARTIHPDMPDSVARYTRKVTIAWAIFFALQVVVSLLIFSLASIETWSVFANILNWPMIIAMFAIEYACRRRCNPGFQHATIRESVMAYLNNRNKV